ncbi:hypothetical protein B5M09_012507 [Aphanomyces astaci]|uniref:Uncharacterized protein n=1 Tax=Aphanomyces astaci TaxID=112090 RepID=A0A425DF31_APHAT|nr:hypothetical protein B5M09_012507 [Aphanomyces astaci]
MFPNWPLKKPLRKTEQVRLREENAHQRTQLAVYHRVHNENKTSHEVLESRVQELLTKWSNNRANRDQQLRIRAVHRFWNWLDKTWALVNSIRVAVLCETYGVLSREGRVPTTVMQRLRDANGIHITTGAPIAPQTNDIVKIPPFTAKASAPPSGNEFKRIPKNPRTSLSQLPPVQSVPGEMLDVCEEVRVTKPWERYRRAGSILLDQDGREGQHEPQFHNSVATFWDRYGQQLWEQTYAPFGNPNHLDPLFHQVFNLHVKLQRLINNTDYDDTHAHFLCFPHPPWSVYYVDLPVIRGIRCNLNAVSDAKALLDFRFDVMKFKELGFLLGLPAVVTTQRYRASWDEAVT